MKRTLLRNPNLVLMTCKHFLALFALLGTFVATGQTREYDFNGFQTSDSNMQWASVQRLTPRKVKFSDSKININLDRKYQLIVKSKKNLPNGGVVYLCKDQQMKDVTITLIANERMFLYSGADRYQVTFNHPIIASAQNSYAEAE